MADSSLQPRTHAPSPGPGTDMMGGFETRDFEALFRSHHRFVWRSLRHLGVAEALVDDAVQEVFIRVHRKLPEYRGDCGERVWIYAFVRRVASLARRTEQRRDRRHRAVGDARARIAAGSRQGERDQLDASLVVERLLAKLRPLDREVIVLVDLEGVSGTELAAILGVAVPTAYGRVRAARQRLRDLARSLHESGNPRLRASVRQPAVVAFLAGAPALGGGGGSASANLTAVTGILAAPAGRQAAAWSSWGANLAGSPVSGVVAGAGKLSGSVALLAKAATAGGVVAHATGVGVGLVMGLVLGAGATSVAASGTSDSTAVGSKPERESAVEPPSHRTESQPVTEPDTSMILGSPSAPRASALPRTRPRPPAISGRPASTSRLRDRSASLPTPPTSPATAPWDRELQREQAALERALVAFRHGDDQRCVDHLDTIAKALTSTGALSRERRELRARALCRMRGERSRSCRDARSESDSSR